MRNRLKPLKIFLVAPLLILFIILVYLGFVNSTSEVYIDLLSKQFRFNVASEKLIKFNIGLPITALQLFNCSLDTYPKELTVKNKTIQIQKVGMTKISKSDEELSSQIKIEKENNCYLRSLNVPAGTKISITKESNVLTLSISQPTITSDQSSEIFGIIGVGDSFMLSGRNIHLTSLETYSDYEQLQITTQKRYPNIAFISENKEIVLQLTLPESDPDGLATLLENFPARNIAFTIIERARMSDRVRSGIKSGAIQFAGINIFRKRFMIKEQIINESEFVDIPNEEVYFVDFIKLNNKGLKISLFSDAAQDIRTGKRSRLVRSISPSMLDVIISEPSKNTVWAIFIFLVTQAAFFSKLFRRKR